MKMNNGEILAKPVICRICLESCDNSAVSYDFDKCPALIDNLERVNLLRLVFQSLSISINIEKTNNKVCDLCHSRLLSTLTFLEMCKKAETILEEHFDHREVIIKVEQAENESDLYLSQTLLAAKMRHPCNTCEKTFITSQRLTTHIRKYHETNAREKSHNQCNLCGENLFSARRLALHLPQCPEREDNKKQVENCPISVEDALTCECCNLQFSSRDKLKRHVLKDLPKKCSQCDKILLNQRQLCRHIRLCHGPASRKFSCSICGRSFSSKNSLVGHENIHNGIKPFLCTFCPVSFHALNTLQTHIARNHDPKSLLKKTKPRSFLCDTCGSSFTRRSHLKRHVFNTHSEAKLPRPFSCTKCGKPFPTAERLTNHMRHHKPRLVACPNCDKTFRTQTLCQLHINRVHLQLRPFPCSTCDRRFKVKAHLDKHMRTHTGEKPFPCPYCCYKCAEKSNLQKHIKIHARQRQT